MRSSGRWRWRRRTRGRQDGRRWRGRAASPLRGEGGRTSRAHRHDGFAGDLPVTQGRDCLAEVIPGFLEANLRFQPSLGDERDEKREVLVKGTLVGGEKEEGT